MKFIFRVEENGYELRFWDEINEEIGDLLVEDWDLHHLHSYLRSVNFHISMKTLERAEKELENGNFVLLEEKENSTFHKELVII